MVKQTIGRTDSQHGAQSCCCYLWCMLAVWRSGFGFWQCLQFSVRFVDFVDCVWFLLNFSSVLLIIFIYRVSLFLFTLIFVLCLYYRSSSFQILFFSVQLFGYIFHLTFDLVSSFYISTFSFLFHFSASCYIFIYSVKCFSLTCSSFIGCLP